MRRYFKEQCVALLASLEKADQQTLDLIRQGQHEVAIRMLADCQQSAIQLGTTIDTLEGEGSKPVHTLEEYCEAVYQLRERLIAGQKVALQQAEADLHQLTDRTKCEIRQDLRTQFEAVFCPYKAAMWDSLESIYRAAAADPDCEVVCIPIPYYDMEDDGSRRAGHYEGDQFPADIPIVRFDTYELEKRHPEMIFIHNPYDQYNKVTTVHPRFFSENLKKYTDCLVYVPYYATAGAMAASQAMLPAYDHADYIITQSPEINDFFDPRVKSKLLPLGSPKFDKVIRTCAEPPEPPEAWRGQLEGRRVFFYNVSLQDFLADTGAALQKMEYVFRTFRSQQDACLLWRPHPLLESTIDTMRPAAREPYEALKQMFISERIGIYDDTADIEASIALSDAYIGDSATSVTALFGVAGKPMYLVNHQLLSAPAEDDWQTAVGYVPRGDHRDGWCITMGNRLFRNTGDLHFRYCCALSDYAGGAYYHANPLEIGGKVYVFPNNAQHILVVDPADYHIRKIELEQALDRDEAFRGYTYWPERIGDDPEIMYLIPNRYPALLAFDLRTEEVRTITTFQLASFDEVNGIHGERIPTARWLWRDHFYILSATGGQLIDINVRTGDTVVRAAGLHGMYTGVQSRDRDHDEIWFLPYEGTTLGLWHMDTDTWEEFDIQVEGLQSIERPALRLDTRYYFSNLAFSGDRIIIAPNWANMFIELDPATGQAQEWTSPLPATVEKKNDYWGNWSTGYFLRDIDLVHWRFYYAPERMTYDIDLETKEIHPVPVAFDKEEIYGLADGFCKGSQWMPYCCVESLFNPLSAIAAGHIHGETFDKQTQIDAYRSVNASPEGDCGDKVYRYMKGQLLK